MGWEERAAAEAEALEEHAERAADALAHPVEGRRIREARRARQLTAAAPDHSAFRLSPEDEAKARSAMAAHAAALPADWSSQAKLAQTEQAQRIGAHAFGCGLRDLRESEISWLATEARRALLGIPALEAAIERARARCEEGIGGAELELAGLRGRLRAARILTGEAAG